MPISFTPGVSEVVGTASQLSGAVTDPVTATQITSLTATQVTGTVTASQGGTGQTALAAGYVFVGNGSTTVTPVPYSSRLIAYTTGMSYLATGDVAMTMLSTVAIGAYCVTKVIFGLPASGALATTLGVALLRTDAAGAGSAITGAFVLTGLAATTAFLAQAVTLASAITTSTALFMNVTTAATTAPASSIYVYGDVLSV